MATAFVVLRRRRKDRESYHEIARDISELARGPWKEYITTRSRSEPRFDDY
nr:hypothetical protein [Candidatus Sigynarchaeum springense]